MLGIILVIISLGVIIGIIFFVDAYEKGKIKFIEKRKIEKRYYECLYDGPTITYEIFKDLYEVNPDRWELPRDFQWRYREDNFESHYVRMSFEDFLATRKLVKHKKALETQAKNNEAMIAIYKSVQRDIERLHEQAKEEIQTSGDKIVEIAERIENRCKE
jgi:hypothetical protein